MIFWQYAISARTALFAAAFLIHFLFASCGTTDPPRWAQVVPPSEPPPYTSIPASDHLVIYLDTSASMAGYVSPDGKVQFGSSPDGQTVFSHTLQELPNIVTALNPLVNIVFRRVYSLVSAPSFSDLDLAQASVNRSIYSGKETNPAGAIGFFGQSLQRQTATNSTDPKAGSKPLLRARFHILITDEVQSTRQQNIESSCDSGSDYRCVRRKIFDLLSAGWIGCVLGIKSEFSGFIYSEINGQKNHYRSSKENLNTFRPFYLYLLSTDQAGLNKLVEEVKRSLRPFLSQEDAIREYVFAASYSDGSAESEIIIPKESAEFLERASSILNLAHIGDTASSSNIMGKRGS